MTQKFFRLTVIAGALAALTALSGCAALVVGGAMVGGTMVVTDRRSSGAQVEDQTIEIKAANRVAEYGAGQAHVNVTSYNRLVLITGEVPTESDKTSIEQAVSHIDNVASVVNELVVSGASSLTSRSSDTLLTSKVKATLVDAKDLLSNAFKVVTERGTVYLMGRVTEREATRAVDLTRSIGGVQRVVRVFDVVSEAELANLAPARDANTKVTSTR